MSSVDVVEQNQHVSDKQPATTKTKQTQKEKGKVQCKGDKLERLFLQERRRILDSNVTCLLSAYSARRVREWKSNPAPALLWADLKLHVWFVLCTCDS